jgi:hypothetical protein
MILEYLSFRDKENYGNILTEVKSQKPILITMKKRTHKITDGYVLFVFVWNCF